MVAQRRAEVLLCAALALLSLAAVGPAYVNHDAAWYLYMVERWLHGARLYRDVIDTNPPLILWLSAPPVLASIATGISALVAFKAYVFIVALASIAAAGAVARRAWPDRALPIVSLTA